MKSAAVTGASGMIGGLIVKGLLDAGWSVRVLTRSDCKYPYLQASVFSSDINDEDGLRRLLEGVTAVFHCAAELNNERKMYSTNVQGTRKLIKLIANTKASYFCHLSSAGVIGPTSIPSVTEATHCYPGNLYEKTKYEAEMLVSNANLDMNVCILRPTNVVSYSMPGILASFINNSWKDKIKIYIKGRENAHIVYAKDVASAAMFFMNNSKSKTNTYLVSRDDDEQNTYAVIYNMYQYINCNNNNLKFSLPIFIPIC